MDPESKLRKNGIKVIAGVDESGRGPLAGPVIAAAVILKNDAKIKGLRDSKETTANERKRLYLKVLENSKTIGVSIIDNGTIDRINILQASLLAMKRAVDLLDMEPVHVIVDGNKKIPAIHIEQTAVIDGDKLCHSVSAASVIAKVIRDEIMELYGRLYPNYGFTAHKGYGTKTHLKLLEKHGPISIHRLTYQPVTDYLTAKGLLFI